MPLLLMPAIVLRRGSSHPSTTPSFIKRSIILLLVIDPLSSRRENSICLGNGCNDDGDDGDDGDDDGADDADGADDLSMLLRPARLSTQSYNSLFSLNSRVQSE